MTKANKYPICFFIIASLLAIHLLPNLLMNEVPYAKYWLSLYPSFTPPSAFGKGKQDY
jgi:hypothetical protein